MAVMDDDLDDARRQAQLYVLQQLAQAHTGESARNFAEAWAWLVSPNQPHG